MAKIMLVEDDNNLREIYGARLQAEGHKIVSAKDGEEALALAVKEKPELIIADIMMPKISGFDMLDILRNAPETKYTKVIMMTALSQTEDKARADKLGADKYLVKSQVTLEDVVATVKEVLGDNEAGTSTAPGPDTPSPAPAPQTPSQSPPPNPNPAPQASPTPSIPQPPSSPGVQPPPSSSISVASPPPSTQPPTTSVPQQPAPPPPPPSNVVAAVTSSANQPSGQTTTGQDGPKSATKIEVVEAPEAASPTPKVNLPTPSGTQNTAQEPVTDQDSQSPVEPSVEQIIDQDNQDDPLEDPDNQPGHKKVIQPINDPLKKPDLSALLAAEENKESVESPNASTVVMPTQTNNTDIPTAPAPEKPNDPHSIAL